MADGFATKPTHATIPDTWSAEGPACTEGPSELSEMLRHGCYDDFNANVAKCGSANLVGANLRMADLTRANLKGADLRNAYLRACDLRGQDLSGCNLDGASLHDAKVSGVLFPANLDAQEIIMSVELGTRMRVR
ncbi:MAG: pentapeptide repeat-containing protein [Nitrospirae bacterium]|nr:pentapeptide repeat-containing protein [Nitrospirota bacterium]